VTRAQASQRRTALITGASAGIGKALAREFAQQGFNIVLTARRAERLEALKNELEKDCAIRAFPVPADLSDPAAPQRIASVLNEREIVVDALVNNAGYNLRGSVTDHSWEAKSDFLQVMAIAPYALTDLFLPGMRARKFGRIMNVSSVVGLIPGGVSNTLYAGAKAMQVSFSEALHVDEAPFGIHVTALCPGLTHSEFHDVDGSRAEMRKRAKFVWLSAEAVAKAGYAALARNDPICVPGLIYKAAVVAARLAPRGLSSRIAARISRSNH
jgi:short-subunit dehydrogenase